MFNTIMEPSADQNAIVSFDALQAREKTQFIDDLVPFHSIANQSHSLDEAPIDDGTTANDQTRATPATEDIHLVNVSVHSLATLKCEDIALDDPIVQVNVSCPFPDQPPFPGNVLVTNATSPGDQDDPTSTSAPPARASKHKKGPKASFAKKTKSKLKPTSQKSCCSISAPKKPKCEYPRPCSGCGHSYKTKQSFWNHKQRCPLLPQNMRAAKADQTGQPDFVHRKEYICAHCERHYRKKYNLRQHLKNTCRGKPCSKGRLQCWESGCAQAFYKYVDLVQHVTLKHGQDLKVQKLQFPNLSAFNVWKTEESNNKFMYARKITGSKRFSNTKYHYFVCQFNHRNEKKNGQRKTARRKKDSLVVPNYNCPSRIMVKECENQILVTYISSHNHELNLANVKYQPLEKEARGYIRTLLQLGVTPQKIIDHLRAGVGNPEIDSFLATKHHFLTLNRIKRMESKLKAKNCASKQPQEAEIVASPADGGGAGDDDESFVPDDSFLPYEIVDEPTAPCPPSDTGPAKTPAKIATAPKESDEVIRSIESNLKKLKGYMHKNSIKEKLSSRISQMIQELCDECEHMESTTASQRAAAPKKPRAASRKRKTASKSAAATTAAAPTATVLTETAAAPTTTAVAPQQTVSIAVPAVALAATITTAVPLQQHPGQLVQLIQQQQPLQTHQLHPQALESIGAVRIVNLGAEMVVKHDKSFTPAINETTDVLKPVFQPFNINLLALKSIDRYISEHEQLLLQQADSSFNVGWLHDAVVNSFLNLVCRSSSNVLAVDTSITEYVPIHQKVPDVWHCFNWADIDTIFIPCNPTKKQWILMVVLVKQLEVQILDPTGSHEDAILSVYKKHEATIQCWYEMLRSFLGIAQWNVTSPQHYKHPDPVNSGILICWYVLQYVNKRSLVDGIDLDHTFRQFVYDAIVNNCSAV